MFIIQNSRSCGSPARFLLNDGSLLASLFFFILLPLVIYPFIHLSIHPPHSLRRLFTGFARAALMDWKETVKRAMSRARLAARANTHHSRSMR